jgi:hypothetical protein
VKRSLRSLGFVATVIFAVCALGWSSTMTAIVQLLATTAFILGGTQNPLVDPNGFDPPPMGNHSLVDSGSATDYVNAATTKYIVTTAAQRGDAATAFKDYNRVATYSPEEFWPTYGTLTFNQSVAQGVHNLDDCVQGKPCTAHIFVDPAGAPTSTYVVFGYSQSARIATIEKRNLIAMYRNPDGSWDDPIDLSFVMIGNPNRPNGGILERFNGLTIPILDVTFDGATPTDTCDAAEVCHLPTVDISRQYDGWSDFPAFPLNLLADINAVAGIAYLHPDYLGDDVPGMAYQGTMGDTTYYLIPTGTLPILTPLAQIGVPAPVLTALDAPLRVMAEWGYDRTASPGAPTQAGLFRVANPITDLVNLAVAIPTGWDDGISEAVGDPSFRPFGTQKPDSPFGVGGPALPRDPAAEAIQVKSVQSQSASDDDDAKIATADQSDGSGGGDRTEVSSTPKLHKGRLRQLIRAPLGADVKAPKAIRNADDRPLKKLVESLTARKPKPRTAADPDGGAGHFLHKAKHTAKPAA